MSDVPGSAWGMGVGSTCLWFGIYILPVLPHGHGSCLTVLPHRQPHLSCTHGAHLQIPYGYSPVMVVDEARHAELEPLLTKFMAAAARGWQAFVLEPETSAREVSPPPPQIPAL